MFEPRNFPVADANSQPDPRGSQPSAGDCFSEHNDAQAPEPWSLTPEAVERWATSARPGDRVVYARGPRLVRTAGVEAMSKLSDDGEVILNWRRKSPGVGEWLATRRAEPERVEPRHRLLNQHAPEPERDELTRTLVVLKRLALGGRPCPTNREIAKLADLNSADQAAYQLRKAISAKLIRVDTDSTDYRVVTILSTGRKTAGRTFDARPNSQPAGRDSQTPSDPRANSQPARGRS